MPKLYFRVESDWEKVLRLREEIVKLESQLKSMDANKAPAAVATLNRQINEAQSQLKGMVSEAAKKAVVMDGDFKSKIYKGSQAVNDFTQKIINQKAVVKDVEADVRRLTDAYRSVRMNPLKAGNALGELNAAKRALNEERSALFDLTQQQANARLSVRKLKDEYALYSTQVKDSTSSIFSLGKALGIIGGVATLKQLGSKILDVRSQFRSAEVSLETIVGEEQAKKLLSKNKQYAKISSLEFMDIQSSTEMMIGFNIEAEKVPRYIEAIGDISRGNSQKFQSLSLAFSQMSAAGKLMGQDLNQMINAGFNPLQFIAEKTGKTIAQLKDEMSKGAISAEMVQQAFIDATSAGGKFYGMSQKQSEEVAGQMSILSDTISNKLNEIGESNEGLIKAGIKGATALVNNYEEIGKAITILITTYGTYKTALVLSTLLEEGGSKALWGKIAATKAATVAQATYNKVLLMNPYVAVTAGVVALGVALYTLSDSTSAQEKEYKKLIDRQEKYDKYLENEKRRIDDLLSILQDELSTREAKLKAFNELQKISPSVFGTYETEKQLVDNLTEARKKENEQLLIKQKMMTSYNQINDINSLKGLKRLQELERVGEAGRIRQGTQAEYQSLYQQFNIKRDKGAFETDAEVIKGKIRAITSIIGADQEKMRQSQQIAWALSLEGMTKESAKAYLKMYEGYRIILRDSGKEWLQIQGEEAPLTDKMLVSRIQSLNDKIINIEEKSAKDYINEAKSAWDKAKKDVEDIKTSAKTYTSADQYEKELKKADDAEKAAKERYEKLGGSTTKKETESEKLRKETEKYNVLLTKQALEEKRRAEDLQMSVVEDRIKAMDEGSKKTIAQMEYNFEKEMQTIDREKEDALRRKIEDARAAFEANPKNKGKSFDSSGITLSDKDIEMYDSRYKSAILSFEKEQAAFKQRSKDSWNDYLKEWGTVMEKRKAITESYSDKIAKAETDGEKESLKKQMQEELSNIDLSELKQSINWEAIFGNLSALTKKQLQDVKKQLVAFKNSPEFKKNASPENVKIIEEAINNLNTAIVDKEGLFGGIESSLLDYKNAVDKVTEAQEKLKEALKSGDDAAIEKARKDLQEAKDLQISAQSNVSKSQNKAISNITAITNAITQLGEADVSLTSLGNTVGTLVDALSESGSQIGGIISALLAVMDQIGQKGLDGFLSDIIESSWQATGGLVESIGKVFGIKGAGGIFKGADYSGYNEMVAQYRRLNDIWDELINSKKEYIEMSYGAEAYKASKEAEELINKSIESYRKLGVERLNSGASTGSRSIGVRQRKRMSSSDWEEAQKALGSAYDKATEGRMTGLFDLSVEQLEKLKSEAPTFWAKLDDDVRGYLNSIIEGQERIEEIQETLKESVTGVSFDSFFDSLLDSLYDVETTYKDIADDMSEHMRKSLIKAFVIENYKDDIRKWYDMWAKSLEDGKISSDEQKALDDLKSSIITGAVESTKLINDQFDTAASSQKNTSKGFNTMDQDTGNELKGRFTALQISGEESKTQLVQQTALLISINEKMSLLNYMKGEAILSTPSAPDIADQNRAVISNSYQPHININFPTDKIDSLASDVFAMKGIIDEMRTLQVEHIPDIAGNISRVVKNSPKINDKLDNINDNIKKAL
jgi:tape measure domain-containing protein